MSNIKIPYGKEHLSANIPQERLLSILSGGLDKYDPAISQQQLVADAMANPIGSKPLFELAKGKKKVVIIASDHTRPVPSKLLIPPMLAEIRRGNPNAEITILIATGCHRSTSRDELVAKFGEDIVNSENIVVHDCFDEANLTELGTLPSGGSLIINRIAAEADLLISEGFIEPHFFAGYSGGRKSVLPGIASAKTVYYNHCAGFISNPNSAYGVLEGNPIHKDMIWAAKKANLAYILNVVINSAHDVIGAFAGDCDEAHLQGVKFLESLCMAEPAYADVVISSNNGYPLDQNIYQAVKGMETASLSCNPGGVIIMVAKCEDGCGGNGFYKTFANDIPVSKILSDIEAVPANETIEDQWQSQIFAKILNKCKVIFVSAAEDKIVKDLRMTPAKTIEEALSLAEKLLDNKNASITVIPEGVSVIIKKKA